MDSRRTGILSALAAVFLFALLFAGGASAQQGPAPVPAGFDLLETDPEQTVFNFQGQTTIPAGFFGAGSEPFQGSVQFGGVPLGTAQGQDVGDADTVVQRKATAQFDSNGNSQPVPIELLQLSLISVAPIQVKVGGGTQLWDVRAAASPTRPSDGTMTISREGVPGGDFDSQLRVYPKFTFTRLSDGAVKQLDVGALPNGQRPDQPLTADNTPWHDGCLPPALATTLNPGFCPGQTFFPAGRIVLTVERSPQVRHAIRPAQPRLEHFVCYAVGKAGEKPVEADLTDQFGKRTAKVDRESGGELCNPVRKNKELKVRNKHDHLRCYVTDAGPTVDRKVLLRNQFLPFAAQVLEARSLCVPSTKQVVPKSGKVGKAPAQRFLVDHFQCYRIKQGEKHKQRTVLLRDQFGRRKLKVRNPSKVCAPVQKNDEAVEHPVQHLVCYRFRKAKRVQRRLLVQNQFGKEELRTGRPVELCVPSIKVPQ